MKVIRLSCHALGLLVIAGLAIVWFKTRSVEHLAVKGFERGGIIAMFVHDGRVMIQYDALRSGNLDWDVEAVTADFDNPPHISLATSGPRGGLVSLKESDDRWHWTIRRVPNETYRGGGRGGGGGRGLFSLLKPGDLAGWTAILPLWALALPPAAFWSLVATRRITRTIRTARRAARGDCKACGYDLRGTPISCPECGRPAPVRGLNSIE
jgi:hypothetical protein